jgi:hypothetical protein
MAHRLITEIRVVFLDNGFRKRERSRFFQVAQYQRQGMLKRQLGNTALTLTSFSRAVTGLKKERTKEARLEHIGHSGNLAVEFSYARPMIPFTSLVTA